jgi:hypothetical protein
MRRAGFHGAGRSACPPVARELLREKQVREFPLQWLTWPAGSTSPPTAIGCAAESSEEICLLSCIEPFIGITRNTIRREIVYRRSLLPREDFRR